jgi:hypothetical protein
MVNEFSIGSSTGEPSKEEDVRRTQAYRRPGAFQRGGEVAAGGSPAVHVFRAKPQASWQTVPRMPLHMDISPLHRLVVIVARGHITAEEIAANTRRLVEANVPGYAKIIDVSQAKSELTREQVQKVADLLRGPPGDTSRGPVAFVINPDRIGFANVFADVTQGERPIQLFRSLHQARAWLDATRQPPARGDR